jgi:hypothetical protein
MRQLIDDLESQYDSLNRRSIRIVEASSADVLFQKPQRLENTFEMFSCGEFTLRSAGAVEQAFSGITTRLWDDPFEWTLPEHLGSPEKVIQYLNEVSETCKRGFRFFTDDSDLYRCIPAPRELRSILHVLLATLVRASHFQGKAEAVLHLISGKTPAAFRS